jgi:hypothetical protein
MKVKLESLHLSPRQQRRYGIIGLGIVQLIVGTMSLVIGILVMTSYMLYFNSAGQAISRENLLDVSVLSFVFGTVVFAVVGLDFLTIASSRPESSEPEWQPSSLYEPNYSPPMYQPTYPPVYQPQVSTREYVTQVRRTIREQSIASTVVTCSNCGREISESDNFCDTCGARAELDSQTTVHP